MESGVPRGREPVMGDPIELLARHPGVGRAEDLLDPRQPRLAKRGHVASSTAWNGWVVFHSGCSAASS